MSVKHQDTYFLDAKTALKVALQANEVNTSSENVKGLQVCYYEAEQPLKDAPQNCIFVPLDNVYNYFVTTKNRFPNEVNFDNTEFSQDERELLNTSIHQILYKSRVERAELIDILMKQVKELKPDFSDKKLRVFVPACRETTVIKNISENIAKTFEKMGYDVCFFIQDNAMQGCVDILPYIHTLHEFNPHIIVNINHLNNEYLNDEVFNFVWFQDTMPLFLDPNYKLMSRKRDFFFGLTRGLVNGINRLGADAELLDFCIDLEVYKNMELKREKKVVFIGSSYKQMIENLKKDKEFKAIFDVIVKNLHKNIILPGGGNHPLLVDLRNTYKKDTHYINLINTYIHRDYILEQICNIAHSDYKIEVYGYGWEDNPIINKYYKGPLKFGEEIANVYNKTTYVLCVGSYILMQRTLEGMACGAIPLILDVRENDSEYNPEYEKCFQFFNLNNINEILKQEPAHVDAGQKLLFEHSYEKLVQRLIAFVHETVVNSL